MVEDTCADGDRTELQQISEHLAELAGDGHVQIDNEYQSFYEWMRERGISHIKEKGLKDSTASNYISRLDQLHRYAISLLDMDNEVTIGPDQADELLLLLAKDTITKQNGEPYDSKRKLSDALKKYFEWRYHTDDLEFEWQPRIKFSDGSHTSAAEFTYEEIGRILEVAQSYGKLPSYYETSAEERDRISGLVAQRLSKPKETVSREDWRKADQSAKIWSLVSVGYDAGLTPIEVSRAKVSWYKPEQQVLEIPTEAASKEREKEIMSLSDESDEAMSYWIRERRHLEKYDGSNRLWLNREGNPYQSGSLCRLVRKLCDEAEVPYEDRPVRWYSLRHSVGRHMKSDGSLSQTNDQLRHDTYETTETTYGNSAAEERRETLNTSRAKAERAAKDPNYRPYSDVDLRTEYGEAKETAPEDAITSTDGGFHVNVHVKDTIENRTQITRQLLSDDEPSPSS